MARIAKKIEWGHTGKVWLYPISDNAISYIVKVYTGTSAHLIGEVVPPNGFSDGYFTRRYGTHDWEVFDTRHEAVMFLLRHNKKTAKVWLKERGKVWLIKFNGKEGVIRAFEEAESDYIAIDEQDLPWRVYTPNREKFTGFLTYEEALDFLDNKIKEKNKNV